MRTPISIDIPMVSQSTLSAKIFKSLELAAAVLQAFTALILIIYQTIFHLHSSCYQLPCSYIPMPVFHNWWQR